MRLNVTMVNSGSIPLVTTMQKYIINNKFYGWITDDGKLTNNYDYNGNQIVSDDELKKLITKYK